IDYDPLSQWCNQYPITPDQATIYDKYGRGLLIESCEQGDINSIKILLTCPDLDINKASSDGATALYAAFFFEQIEVIRLLLKHPGIDVNKINPNGETVLHNACHQERVDLIELLLSCTDIDINKTSITGLTALDVACDMGEIRIIQRLLSHQAIDLCKLRDNTMALDRAFIQNNDKVILEFMKHIEKNKLSIHNYISPGTLEKVKNWLNDSVAAREFNSLLYVIQYVKNNLLVNAEAKSSVTKNNQCAMLHGLDNAPLASGGLFNSSAQKRSLGACEKGYSTKKSHHLDKENAQEYVQLGL
ncbi:MAG: ankyrin repeat domain-containing protein, partial [Legionella sp.]